MSKEARSYDLLWLSVALVFVVGLFFYMPIKANDYWWYMRVGRDVLSTGSIPSIETISYSRAGDAIINQQWLAGVIFYLVYQLGGVNLTYLLGGACIAFTYGLVWWMARQASGPRLATLLVYILVLCTSNNWVMRPQLMGYPLFILCIWSIYKWQEGESRYLFLLPLSEFLWVNLHGSFVLPFILAGTALVFGNGNRKSLLMYTMGMLIAMLLNPYGLRIWSFFIANMRSPTVLLYSSEWRAPNIADWQDRIFFIWLLCFAPMASFSRNKLTIFEWVLFLGFGWLSLTGSRYIIWFMLLVVIFSAKVLAEWSNKWMDRPVQKISLTLNTAIAFVVFLSSFTYIPMIRTIWQRNTPSPYDLDATPFDAVSWLSQHKELPGSVWNDYAFGPYLSFTLPERPVWIDPRFHIYPSQQWDEYLKVDDAQNWQAVFDRERVNLLILSTKRQPVLIQVVSESVDWCEQYEDQYAVIYSRCNPVK